jgi:diguanylate cyclase (GGDEF)-like protein/PAS domain S-box-containing protein
LSADALYPRQMRVDAETLLDLLPDMVVVADAAGTITYANAAIAQTLGWPLDHVVGRSAFEFVHPDEQRLAIEAISSQVDDNDEGTRRHHVELARRDGTFCKVELHAALAPGTEGTVMMVMRDLAERTEIQRQAHRNEEQLRALTENVPDAVGRFDEAGQLVFATRRFKEVVDAHDGILDLWAGHAKEALTEGALVEVEHTLVDDGPWIAARFVPERGMEGQVTHVLVIASDITLRKQNELRLMRAATHDPLTGLVNRDRFRELAERSLRRSADRDGADDDLRQVALVFIDLDDFKVVNDAHGHAAGDQVLVVVGQRLADMVRPQDVVARYGGDEFLMLCDGLGDTDAVAVADRVTAALAEPISLSDGTLVCIGASAGVAATATADDGLDDLLSAADAAMYRSKPRGVAGT